MKIDRERYEKDEAYKAKVDAQRVKRREYMRKWMKRVREGKVAVSKKEKTTQEPTVQTLIRRVVCLGCAPGACCILHIPCPADAGFVKVFCPADGKETVGVCHD